MDWFPKPALELEQVVLNEINWHAHPFKVIADDPWLLIYSPPPPSLSFSLQSTAETEYEC